MFILVSIKMYHDLNVIQSSVIPITSIKSATNISDNPM